jgi:AP-2 complex subunit alpha
MCNYNNVGKIVEEMLNFSEETDMQIKEELVLKIAILSEKFAPNLTWYIDVIIRLLSKSGDYITDDIWWRVIQIITGNFLVVRKIRFWE